MLHIFIVAFIFGGLKLKINQELFAELYRLKEEDFHKNFEFLGEGISRKVFALNEEYVIKVAKDMEGYYQNKIEQNVYCHAPVTLQKYLCPIGCFKPKLMSMKRAEPLSRTVQGKYVNLKTLGKEAELLRDLSYLADRFNLFYEDLICVSSWGRLEDRLVLIDYGCTSYNGDFYYEMYFIMNKLR
jgi:hypothetical protein